MTKPSHQDDLPSRPWTVRQFEHAWEIRAADGGLICFVQSETLARAIAAIPEMRAQIGSLKAEIDWHCEEINRLRAEMDYNVSIRERLKLLEDNNRDLRAEKAELQKQNDALRGTYPRNIGAEITEAFADNQCLRAEKATIEAATIERCAKLADAHDPFEGGIEMPVGDAIRALAKENET